MSAMTLSGHLELSSRREPGALATSNKNGPVRNVVNSQGTDNQHNEDALRELGPSPLLDGGSQGISNVRVSFRRYL